MIQVFPDPKAPLPLGVLIHATRLEFECLGLSSPERPTDETIQPGRELNAIVRAGFVRQQTTIAQWCREEGIAPGNARFALMGGWTGPKAQQLVRRLVEAAGVEAEVTEDLTP